jgi:hypothetical protein
MHGYQTLLCTYSIRYCHSRSSNFSSASCLSFHPPSSPSILSLSLSLFRPLSLSLSLFLSLSLSLSLSYSLSLLALSCQATHHFDWFRSPSFTIGLIPSSITKRYIKPRKTRVVSRCLYIEGIIQRPQQHAVCALAAVVSTSTTPQHIYIYIYIFPCSTLPQLGSSNEYTIERGS